MAHVLVVPLPAQGHMNPMVQFARRLASKGVATTLVTTRFVAPEAGGVDAGPAVVEAISDGHDEGGLASVASVAEYLEKQAAAMSASLAPGGAHRGARGVVAGSGAARALHVRRVRLVRALGAARGAAGGPARRPLLHAVVRGQRRVLPLQPGEARRAAAVRGRRRRTEQGARGAAGDGEVGVPVVRVRGWAVPDDRRERAETVRP